MDVRDPPAYPLDTDSSPIPAEPHRARQGPRLPREGPLGAHRGRRRGPARVHAAPEGVHEHDAGRAEGPVLGDGLRRRGEGGDGRHERRRGVGLLVGLGQRVRRGHGARRGVAGADDGGRLRDLAHHG